MTKLFFYSHKETLINDKEYNDNANNINIYSLKGLA